MNRDTLPVSTNKPVKDCGGDDEDGTCWEAGPSGKLFAARACAFPRLAARNAAKTMPAKYQLRNNQFVLNPLIRGELIPRGANETQGRPNGYRRKSGREVETWRKISVFGASCYAWKTVLYGN